MLFVFGIAKCILCLLCLRQVYAGISLIPGSTLKQSPFFSPTALSSGPSFTMLSPFAQKNKVKLHSGIIQKTNYNTSSPCS